MTIIRSETRGCRLSLLSLSDRKTRFCTVTTELQVGFGTVKQLNDRPLLLYSNY